MGFSRWLPGVVRRRDSPDTVEAAMAGWATRLLRRAGSGPGGTPGYAQSAHTPAAASAVVVVVAGSGKCQSRCAG